MNFQEDIRPVTYLKQKAARLLAEVGKNRRPVVITRSGEAKAVVMDIRSYERNKRALFLLKLIQVSEEEIKKGKVKPQEEVFQSIEDLIASRRQ